MNDYMPAICGQKFFLSISDSQRFRFSAFTHLAAASNQITSVEISGQRLMLQRNGSPILMDGSRYPRLT
ncbi:MAG: hypothetical protein OEV91_11805, partial [Desulfobulbaceae bacterium]|nr:hypothetical protein [Desulfobulbaceae bacterium]